MAEQTLTVDLAREGSPPRLERVVHAALPGWSRRLVRRLIAEGYVRVNGRPAAKGVRLRHGDRVVVPLLSATLVPEAGLAVPVVYEDDLLVALDKPGGMPAHALDPREHGTAAAFLLARHPEVAAVGDPLAPGLVHRLDTGTSGLLLAARTPQAHAALRAALRTRQVEKRYLAVVAGDANRLDGIRLTHALAHDRRDRRRMAPAPAGARAWEAETLVRVRARGAEHSLVEATIRTGVTHQVRAQLALAGHPVLNDALYGGPAVRLAVGRHALHAAHLALAHPADGRTLALDAPLPADLRELVS